MTQFTPDAAQCTLNTELHMGQAYMPGFCYPPPATHSATPKNTPVASLPGAGPGVAHSTSSSLGAASPYAAPMQHPGYLYSRQGPGLATGSVPTLVPQAPGLSVGEKRVAEDLGGRDAKRIKTGSSRMKNDPLFRPTLNQHGQPNGKFVCLKDGMVLNPESYLKHIRTQKHLGHKLEKYKCPVCSRTYSRLDACKRHFYDRKCGKLAAGGPSPSFAAGPASTSSTFVAPGMVPTMAFTYPYLYPMPQNAQIAPPAAFAPQLWAMPTFAGPKPCLSQSPENDTVTEPAEDDEDDDNDADFWENNEIQDVDEM